VDHQFPTGKASLFINSLQETQKAQDDFFGFHSFLALVALAICLKKGKREKKSSILYVKTMLPKIW
jgi:hypothetical protein